MLISLDEKGNETLDCVIFCIVDLYRYKQITDNINKLNVIPLKQKCGTMHHYILVECVYVKSNLSSVK